MDVRRVLLVLQRWWPVLIAGVLIASAAAYGTSKLLPRVYEATALIEVDAGLSATGAPSVFNELQASWAIAGQDAQLIRTTPIAQQALNQVGPRLRERIDPGTLLKNTRTTVQPQTSVISLIVRANDPADAALLANAMASAFIDGDNRNQARRYDEALAAINNQLQYYSAEQAKARQQSDALLRQTAPLTPAQQAQSATLLATIQRDQGMIGQLQSMQQDILLHRAGAGITVTLSQQAVAPADPVSPRTAVNTAVAAVLALFVLLGLAILADVADTRPRTPAEVVAALDLPLLGTIRPAGAGNPVLAALEAPASPLADDYRRLRAYLLHEEGGSGRAVTVTALHAQDGTTTITANLAAIAARSGIRVILVDANLRHPALHRLFGLSERTGLVTALREGNDVRSLLQPVKIPTLRVLPAGPAASELIDALGSPLMRTIMAHLRDEADLVLLDTAPATLPEATILAGLSDTALLVAPLRRSERATLSAVTESFRRAGITPCGVAVPLFVAPKATPATTPVPAPATETGSTGLRSAK